MTPRASLSEVERPSLKGTGTIQREATCHGPSHARSLSGPGAWRQEPVSDGRPVHQQERGAPPRMRRATDMRRVNRHAARQQAFGRVTKPAARQLSCCPLQTRERERSPNLSHSNSTMIAPMIEPKIPDGWKKPSERSEPIR